jgi:hypothetical protein
MTEDETERQAYQAEEAISRAIVAIEKAVHKLLEQTRGLEAVSVGRRCTNEAPCSIARDRRRRSRPRCDRAARLRATQTSSAFAEEGLPAALAARAQAAESLMAGAPAAQWCRPPRGLG